MGSKGLIHIYCGDGKGKTTASIGLSIRALGRGFRIVFVQFLKWQETGELAVLKKLPGISIVRGEDVPHKFTWNMTEEEKTALRETHNQMLRQAISLCAEEKCLLVMDELIGTYDMGLIDRELVLDFLRNKPEGLEVVMTGRNPAEELKKSAHYISEVKKIKHPMDEGIAGRKGIEM